MKTTFLFQVQQCQSIAFNCDGTKLVCGAFDKKVSVANVDGGRLRFSWVGSSHSSSVEQVYRKFPHLVLTISISGSM